LPRATISAENRYGSKKGSKPVSDRVSRIFASLPEDATHFGWASASTTSRTPATGRSSAPKASASAARTLHEIRRQSPAPLLLDAVDHGAHADAGIAGAAVVHRQRKSDRGELARQHAGGDDLGIDEDAVAVEDDEGGSRGNGHPFA
jgi:hypothetical protein